MPWSSRRRRLLSAASGLDLSVAHDMIPSMTAYLLALLILLAIAMPACYPSAAGQAMVRGYLWLTGFRGRRLSLPAGELAWLEGGSGGSVLLIHGFGGDGPTSWGRVMAGLVRRHHVLVPDLLCFGRSHAADEQPSLLAQADALQALIQARVAGSLQVVGLSYGGFVALELARRMPERISQLVIMASPGMAYTEEDQQALLRRAQVASAEQLFVPADAQGVARLMAMVGSPLARAPRFLLQDVWQYYYRDRARQLRALMQELANGQQQYLARHAQPPSMPAAVVWGSQDEIFPLQLGQRLALALNAPLFTIDGGTHVLPVVCAAQTLAVLQQILHAPA